MYLCCACPHRDTRGMFLMPPSPLKQDAKTWPKISPLAQKVTTVYSPLPWPKTTFYGSLQITYCHMFCVVFMFFFSLLLREDDTSVMQNLFYIFLQIEFLPNGFIEVMIFLFFSIFWLNFTIIEHIKAQQPLPPTCCLDVLRPPWQFKWMPPGVARQH